MKNMKVAELLNGTMLLQLFANPNTNVTTDQALDPTMKEFYDTALLENARNQHYFNQFGMAQSLPKNHGNTIEFRKFNTFDKALTPLTEGVTPDGNKLGMTKITTAINQYGDYSTISDRLELEAVDPIIMGATEEHGAQAGDTLDTLTRNVVNAGTNVYYGGGKTSRAALTASDIITGALVDKCATTLKKGKRPKINNDYVAIVHPSVASDLRHDSEWLAPHNYVDSENIYNGEIGKLHGVRFVEDTEQKVYWGEDLCETSRTLTLSSNVTAASTITVTETLEANALVGRYVLIAGTKCYVSANTTNQLTLKQLDKTTAASVTASTTDPVYPGEGGAAGIAVYATTFISKDAYARVNPTAESMEMIIKQRGSAGTADPLDQRSTVGWKASHGATILYEEGIVRLETGSSYSSVDEGN